MKKTKFFTALAVIAAFLVMPFEVAAGPREDYIKQLMDSQPDSPKATIKDGKMVGFFVVGVAAMPRSMAKNKAKNYARKAARRDAEKKVSQFFNTSVQMSEGANGETILTTVGEASGDTGPAVSKESSATIERTSEAFQKVSASAQSGLEGEGYQIKDGELVEVYSWSAEKSRALRGAIRNMGATADTGVKAANKVEQTRQTGATETPAAPAQTETNKETPAPAPAPAGSNEVAPETTQVAPAAPSEDFF